MTKPDSALREELLQEAEWREWVISLHYGQMFAKTVANGDDEGTTFFKRYKDKAIERFVTPLRYRAASLPQSHE